MVRLGRSAWRARDRLRGSLQAALLRLSQGFQTEISDACRAVMPESVPAGSTALEAGLASRYRIWAGSAGQGQVFSGIALAISDKRGARLRRLDVSRGSFADAEWPGGWTALRRRLESIPSPGPRDGRNPPGPPNDGAPSSDGPYTIETPLFAAPDPHAPPGSVR